MNTHQICQKVYLRHYTPKNKKPGDICGEPTLETWGNLCSLHCSIEYQYMINQQRKERLSTERALRSSRLLEKVVSEPIIESGIEIVIQKMKNNDYQK